MGRMLWAALEQIESSSPPPLPGPVRRPCSWTSVQHYQYPEKRGFFTRSTEPLAPSPMHLPRDGSRRIGNSSIKLLRSELPGPPARVGQPHRRVGRALELSGFRLWRQLFLWLGTAPQGP